MGQGSNNLGEEDEEEFLEREVSWRGRQVFDRIDSCELERRKGSTARWFGATPGSVTKMAFVKDYSMEVGGRIIRGEKEIMGDDQPLVLERKVRNAYWRTITQPGINY